MDKELNLRIESLQYWIEELNDTLDSEAPTEEGKMAELWNALNLIEIRARHTKYFIEENYKLD